MRKSPRAIARSMSARHAALYAAQNGSGPDGLSGIAADAPSRTRRTRSESSPALTNGMSHATTSAMSTGGNRRERRVKTDDAAALGPNVAVNGNTGEPLVGVRRVGDEDDLRRHGANRRRHSIDDANAADPSQSLRLAAEPLVRSAGDDGARHSAMRVSGHASPAGSSPAASGLRRSTLLPRAPIRARIARGRE